MCLWMGVSVSDCASWACVYECLLLNRLKVAAGHVRIIQNSTEEVVNLQAWGGWFIVQ